MTKKKGPWRDLWGHFVAPKLSGRRCPHPSCRKRTRRMSDEALENHLRHSHKYTDEQVSAAVKELDRRDALTRRRTEGRERRKSERLSASLDHQEITEASYRAAVEETRGHMLSPAGKRAGIDERTLWTGTEARARKYASEELREFWDKNGRLTKTEYDRTKRANNRAERETYQEERRLYGVY